jgi:tetratricopeptide (TPR) repeat protein
MLPPTPALLPPTGHRHRNQSSWRQMALATLVCIGIGSNAAWAQAAEYAEVNRLVRAGQFKEALGQVEQYLAGQPRDPQMRFFKGVIQTESGQPADAISTFTKLTEDFPELPEPYNNLAVLHASQSQFDKARAALEMAIRTNPDYATAYDNLGDVYAKLASQAYTKALELDASNTGVPPKLRLIGTIFTSKLGGKTPSAPLATAKPTASLAAGTAASGNAARPGVTAAPPAAVAAAPAVEASSQSEVQAAVTAWAKAWSARDTAAYLGAYAAAFAAASGQSRSAWAADRQARVAQQSRIEVELSDLSVEINGDRATARFQQAYRSDTLNTSSSKTLELVQTGGRWLIVRETTGS